MQTMPSDRRLTARGKSLPEVVDQEERGPVLRFGHFRYFGEGELMLRTIAPQLEKAMHNCRFRLYGFSQIQEQEIPKTIH